MAFPWAAVGAAGSLLSGASGLFGGGEDKGPSLQEQSQLARKHEIQSFDDRIRQYEKYGINKLMAVGANPASGGMQFQFGGSGGSQDKSEALYNMGQGISRAASAFDTPDDRKLKELTLASAAADVEGKLLHNQRLKSELRLMTGTGTPPPIPGESSLSIDPERRAFPRHSYLYEGDGSVVPVLNENAGDNEILMAWDFIKHTGPAELKNAFLRTYRRFGLLPNIRRFKERR